MGMGLSASGDTYLVKMLTASFSIPATKRRPLEHNLLDLIETVVLQRGYSLFISLSESSRSTPAAGPLTGVPVLDEVDEVEGSRE